MVDNSSTEEQLRRKIKITQATVEGTKARVEDLNTNDEVAEGLFWAFEELKQAAVNHLESQ